MRTLKGRMTDLIATVLVLALLSGWFLVGNTVEERMISQAKENLLSRIAILAGVIQDTGIEGLITNISRWSRDDGTRVTLVAMNGKVLFDNEADPGTMDNHAGRPEIREALLSGTGINTRYSRSIEADQIYVARLAADPSGEGIVLRLSISLADVGSAVGSARRRILASLCLCRFCLSPGRTLLHKAGFQAPGGTDEVGPGEHRRNKAAFSQHRQRGGAAAGGSPRGYVITP